MNNYVEGKVVVVTGSGFGFGRIVCQKVARMGGFPVVSDIDEARMKETVRLIQEEGYKAVGTVCDVRNLEDCKNLVKLAVDTYGKVDVFVNNAGIMPSANWSEHEIALAAWDRSIDINLRGTMYGTIAVYDQMIAQGYGHVVCISSIAGNAGYVGGGVYSATKIGVRYLARSLRREAHGKIKVSIVNPTGVPDTDLLSTVVSDESDMQIYGTNREEFLRIDEEMRKGTADPAYSDRNSIKYMNLDADSLTDNIIYCINQPWGVLIDEITVRTSNDLFCV